MNIKGWYRQRCAKGRRGWQWSYRHYVQWGCVPVDVLGHSSIETTRIYIKTTCDEYQRQIDLMGYEIPLYLKSLVPEYKIKIRHHTYNMYDTVLYASV